MSLKIRSLNKRFSDKKILENFSYEFKDSGIYAILGKSGIGKTTLLRLISGLDKRYSGEIVGGGASNTSVAFQEYRLFPQLTVIENVVLPNSDTMSAEKVKEAEILLLKLGFSESELSMYPEELSGGMKQRVSLARAILRNKPILLLDEPTKELNEELSELVLEILLEISKSRLVILVTHNLSDVEKVGATEIFLDGDGNESMVAHDMNNKLNF